MDLLHKRKMESRWQDALHTAIFLLQQKHFQISSYKLKQKKVLFECLCCRALWEPPHPARGEWDLSFPSPFPSELSAGSQLEEDSIVLLDPFSWCYHF